MNLLRTYDASRSRLKVVHGLFRPPKLQISFCIKLTSLIVESLAQQETNELAFKINTVLLGQTVCYFVTDSYTDPAVVECARGKRMIKRRLQYPGRKH